MEQPLFGVRQSEGFGRGVREPRHARRMAERPDRLEIGDAREGEGHIVEARGVRGGVGFRLHLQEVLPERFAFDRVEEGAASRVNVSGDRRIELAARALLHDLERARPAGTVMRDLGDVREVHDPHRHEQRFPRRPSGTAFAVPAFADLGEGGADTGRHSEQPREVRRDVADRIGVLIAACDLPGEHHARDGARPLRESLARADLGDELPDHVDRIARGRGRSSALLIAMSSPPDRSETSCVKAVHPA